MSHFYQLFFFKSKHIVRTLLIGFLFSVSTFSVQAQCPANIDFEEGTFAGWECWLGTTSTTGTTNNINLALQPGPIANIHTMLTSTPGNGLDAWGFFPKNCPNGSGHSIQLGNDGPYPTQPNRRAEGVSYTFTIPANQNQFTLIYNYAMVIREGGTSAAHAPYQEARFVVTVENLTDGTPLPCPLDPFIATGALPGFQRAPNSPSDANGAVYYKDWSAASIDLNNLAGKTIRLFFKTAGCTQGGHFGYGYVDVNAQCSSAFTGATFCPDDTLVKVTAPFGYQTYEWFNGLHNTSLGFGQVLTLKPPPLSGDSVIVHMKPYSGYGCENELKAYLWDTLTVTANAGPNRTTCDAKPVQLGIPPTPGLVYKWSPVTGLSNPNIANPLASPGVSTHYTLTVTNTGGGCATSTSVDVDVDVLSDSLQLIGSADYCTGSGLSTVLKMLAADSLQWYKDNAAIPGATGQTLNVTQTGAYYGMQFSDGGCTRTTRVQQVNIYQQPIASFTANSLTQCFPGNSFVLTNNTIVSGGTPGYKWNMGDGTEYTTTDVMHHYAAPGTYTVTLSVAAPGGCTDDSVFTITVDKGVNAIFSVDKPVQCFKNNSLKLTNESISYGVTQYNWNMGDGSPILHTQNVNYTYALPGTYVVNLSGSGAPAACSKDSSFTVVINPSPVAGFTINNNAQCFPGHQFVLKNTSTVYSGTADYTWSMGNDSALITSTDLNYSYAKAGAYTIKLLASTVAGCADSIFQNVEVYATPLADFTIRPVCENLTVPIINRSFNNTNSTVNYLWNFGNGHTDNVKSPVYSYPVAGNYFVSLSVSTVQCPLTPDTKILPVTIDAPVPAITYPDKDAAYNFPEPLQARQFGTSVTWAPPTGLSNRFSYTPTFTGITPQLYTVTIKTATGCITVDTQFVQTHKKIEIYVPNAFTPNANGVNDRLRPVLIGFTKVNYFRIYNRWGQLLFTMNSDQPGWDGKINNKPAEIQTVIWMIEAVDVDGNVHNRQGTTVLYR